MNLDDDFDHLIPADDHTLIFECRYCGALVGDPGLHRTWHNELSDHLDDTVFITPSRPIRDTRPL